MLIMLIRVKPTKTINNTIFADVDTSDHFYPKHQGLFFGLILIEGDLLNMNTRLTFNKANWFWSQVDKFL